MRKTGELDRQALQCLMRGASVLGTGGGGSYTLARALVDELAARTTAVKLCAVEDLPEGAFGVSTVILGGGLSHDQLMALPMSGPRPATLRAADALAAHLQRRIDFVYPIEIGPQNTLEAVRLAALLDVPLLDADAAGRAVPELLMTTFSAGGLSLTPYAVSTFQGDLLVVPEVADESRNEALCRALAIASGGLIALCGFSLDAVQARRVLIRRTLSRCIEIGALIGPGRQPAAALAERLGGRIAFRGRVESDSVGLGSGFFRGQLRLRGSHAFSGETYLIGIQNEFLWSWREAVLDVACPDLLCVIDSDSGLGKVTYGHGFENALEPGQDLTVLHLPAAPNWRDPALRNPFPPPPALPVEETPC